MTVSTQEWAVQYSDGQVEYVSEDPYYPTQMTKERCRVCDHCRGAQSKVLVTRWVSTTPWKVVDEG